jgi:hypothetical protein
METVGAKEWSGDTQPQATDDQIAGSRAGARDWTSIVKERLRLLLRTLSSREFGFSGMTE